MFNGQMSNNNSLSKSKNVVNFDRSPNISITNDQLAERVNVSTGGILKGEVHNDYISKQTANRTIDPEHVLKSANLSLYHNR